MELLTDRGEALGWATRNRRFLWKMIMLEKLGQLQKNQDGQDSYDY